MAKGYKTGGKNWQPGQSGNPLGRPIDHDKRMIAKALRNGSRIEVEAEIRKIMAMSQAKFNRAVTEPNERRSMLSTAILNMVGRASRTTDEKKMAFLFGYLAGTPDDTSHVERPPLDPNEVLESLRAIWKQNQKGGVDFEVTFETIAQYMLTNLDISSREMQVIKFLADSALKLEMSRQNTVPARTLDEVYKVFSEVTRTVLAKNPKKLKELNDKLMPGLNEVMGYIPTEVVPLKKKRVVKKKKAPVRKKAKKKAKKKKVKNKVAKKK